MAEELTPDLMAFIRQQKDRQEIWDCLLRYTRGVDRHDKAMMESAYHPDAMDEHGVAAGNPGTFCDWAIGFHRQAQFGHSHIITNHSVELDGDSAHAETYYIFFGDNRDDAPTLAFGRYIDRFEKRAGEWRIAHRVCLNEYSGSFNRAETEETRPWYDEMRSTGPSARNKTDISYVRPLTGSLPGNPRPEYDR